MKTETQLDLFKDQSNGHEATAKPKRRSHKRGKYAVKDYKNKHWTTYQVKRLRAMIRQGTEYSDIAKELGRTEKAVYTKVWQLGLTAPAKATQEPKAKAKAKTVTKKDYPQPEPRVRISDVQPVPTPLSESTVTGLVKRFDLDRDVLHKCVNKLANRMNAADSALGEQEVFNHNQRITNRLYAIMHGVTLFVVVLIAVQVFS